MHIVTSVIPIAVEHSSDSDFERRNANRFRGWISVGLSRSCQRSQWETLIRGSPRAHNLCKIRGRVDADHAIVREEEGRMFMWTGGDPYHQLLGGKLSMPAVRTERRISELKM
jgi:hypothetical protein